MKSADLMQYVTPDENPGCGFLFRYRGTRVSQSRRIFEALDQLNAMLPMGTPRLIVEIGTLYGGFTRILRDHDISTHSPIYTFDIKDTVPTVFDLGTNVNRILGDVFTVQRTYLRLLLTQPIQALVFCDGGAKEREVNEFCAYLKAGDLIMCHDYVKHPDDLKDQALVGDWPSYESQWCNVKDALTANGCEPFAEDVMRRALWGCWVKR